MATTCSHGLPASECLICRTLAPPAAPTPPTSARPAAYSGLPGSVGPVPVRRRSRSTRRPSGAGDVPARRMDGVGAVTHVGGVLVAIAVIGVVIWLVSGVVAALFHVAELIVVAAAAGWVGYRLGYFRGHRAP